jgi:hypothetical protein
MINLFKIKDQKKGDAANTNGRPAAKKQSPGELRLHKGLLFSKQCCSKLHCGGPYTMAMWCCLVAY